MEKASSEMTALVEGSSIMRDLALPERGNRALMKIRIKLPDWTYRHVKSVYYAEPGTRIDADQMKQLRRAAKIAREEHEATNEVRALRERLERLERLLLAPDEESYCPTIEAARVAARGPEREGEG